MLENFNKLLKPFLALPFNKRIVVVVVVAISAISFTVLVIASNKSDYKALFTNLSTEDAGEVVKKLKEQKVPYQIAGDGKAVMVPADKVYDLRLSLASEGLPQGGGIGFEIFDRKNFGMTEFVQKINYKRALQGELARTIGQISGVDQARVHLAIPEKALFTDSEKPTTASVIIKMKSTRSLQENEVQGIIHLVASSVEGMDPSHVTVLDGRGKILTKGGPGDLNSKMTTAMMETERGYEKNLEGKLQTLLNKVVGSDKSVARVSASFDFKQVEKYEEQYDPKTAAVRSEQRSEEKAGLSNLIGGIPGVQTNLSKVPVAPPRTVEGGSRSDETRNFEVGRVTSRTIEPVGTLSKVSVAILVDGSYETPSATGKKSTKKPKYIPRTAEEIQKIEALVKSAAGIDSERGDQLTVVNIPFTEISETGDDGRQPWWHAPIYQTLLKNVLIGVGFLSLLFLVLKPMLRIIRTNASEYESAELVNNQLQKALSNPLRGQLESQPSVSQIELIEHVKKEPYQTAQILKSWLDNK